MTRNLDKRVFAHFRYKVFALPLVFYLIQTVLLDYLLRGRLFLIFLRSPDQGLFYFQLIQYLVIPALLFLVSYLMGKNIQLKDELLTVINSLFLGSVIGSIFSFGYGFLASAQPKDISNPYMYALNFSFYVFRGLQMFFISFTALAIAYLRRE